MTNVQDTTQAHNDNRWILDPKSPEVARLISSIMRQVDELQQLGKEAAREAWAEHAGDPGAIAACPDADVWSERASARGLLDGGSTFGEVHWRAFWRAYWNELLVLGGLPRELAVSA